MKFRCHPFLRTAAFVLLTAFSVVSVPTESWAERGSRFTYSGQLAGLGQYGYTYFNGADRHAFRVDGRYLPQISFETSVGDHGLFDLEISGDFYGTVAWNSAGFGAGEGTAKWDIDGRIRPYRGWLRYSNERMEVRLGLQKINFGSAQLLRPLMWFDAVDPRDPLQFTEGVWGGLFRYYFKNNSNLWLWALTGNSKTKGWEMTANSRRFSPEFGGRYQMPIPAGEAALTVHYRQSTTVPVLDPETISTMNRETGEFRVGLDARVDVGVGLCIESTYQRMFRDVGLLNNQFMFSGGVDYTFGVGNGLMVDLEHLVYAYGDVDLSSVRNMTALMSTYPVGFSDMLSFVGMYGWDDHDWHLFLGWKRDFDAWSLNLNAFWNSKLSSFAPQHQSDAFFGVGMESIGVQLIVIWNHSVE